MRRWTTRDIPNQRGRLAIVTGAGGIGFEDALALAQAGAEIIIASRNPAKGAQAIARIRKRAPDARVRFEQLDLASLKSVADFAGRIRAQTDALHLLINNAAVMDPPTRLETADGFELQLGTNYLGHFALTAHLMPLLRNGRDARVITLSSIAAHGGAMAFDDLQSLRTYRPRQAYAQSKLACLMFAQELNRRSDAAGWGVKSIGAHPGVARTDLLHNAPGRWSAAGIARSVLWFLFQPAPQGALPTLFAATAPEAEPGAYYGPDGLAETRGYPRLARVPRQANEIGDARRLWDVSEHLTGVRFS